MPEKIVQRHHRLEVYWNRWWSLFMLVCFGVIFGICMAMAIASWPDRPVLFSFAAIFTVLMAIGLWRSCKQLITPPLMFMADRAGITTYLFEGEYRETGYLVPWSKIESMEIVERRSAGGDGGHNIMRTVALRLSATIEAATEVSAGGSDDASTIHIDANTGTLRGNRLLAKLREMKRVMTGRA